MELQPHQQRVVTEKQELDEKINKLSLFLTKDFYKSLDSDEQVLLQMQLDYMNRYYMVLRSRIFNFKK